MRLPLVAAVLAATPATATEDAFVEANLLSILYHELGHAIIDLMDLPVFGQEEDAADVASVLLLHAFFEEDTAQDLAYDAAFGFAAEALLLEAEGETPAWWDVHGPDEQRFYNTVCLFYGGNPEDREDFAYDMDLPDERAETCEEEFDLAWESWGSVLDDMAATDGFTLEFGGGTGFAAQIVGAEVAALNTEFRWPDPVIVTVAPCGEANAWYDPQGPEIRVCTEFEPHLRALTDPVD